MSHDQCISCGNFHAWDDECRPCPVSQDDELPAILQLQADPFPTESDALAEQGFIEQDASAPIKEQTSWLQRENAMLKTCVAALTEQLKESDQRNDELARKAAKYDCYVNLMAELINDIKV